MRSARINFVDHPDGTFSMRPVFLPLPTFAGSGFQKECNAHQICATILHYLDHIHSPAPADSLDALMIDEAEANRDTLESGASMEFTEFGEDFNLHVKYWPGQCDEKNPSHKACALGVAAINLICKAVSDALVKRGGEKEDVYLTIPKESLNLIRSMGVGGNA